MQGYIHLVNANRQSTEVLFDAQGDDGGDEVPGLHGEEVAGPPPLLEDGSETSAVSGPRKSAGVGAERTRFS